MVRDGSGVEKGEGVSVTIGIEGPRRGVEVSEVADGVACSEREFDAVSLVAEFVEGIPFASDEKAGAIAHFEGRNTADEEDELAGVEGGLGGVEEVEIDAFGEADIGEIERGCANVFELEIFEEVVVIKSSGDLGGGWIGGMIHDLGDDEAIEVV